MNKVIAVEDNLGNVKSFLASKGCMVVDINSAMNNQVDAIVMSGSDMNIMGMQDVVINAPIISARGKSPEDIYNDIMHR